MLWEYRGVFVAGRVVKLLLQNGFMTVHMDQTTFPPNTKLIFF